MIDPATMPVARQMTVQEVAWVFGCDPRTVRAGIAKSPPEITFYKKFDRVYFDPADVLAAIVGSKVHALRNGDGAVVATDVEKLWARIQRFLLAVTEKDTIQMDSVEEGKAA